MGDKIKLTKIELRTADGKTVALTIEEARELHGQLDALFGMKYVPTTPIIVERDRWPTPYHPWHPMWYTTCVGDEHGSFGLSGSSVSLTCSGSRVPEVIGNAI